MRGETIIQKGYQNTTMTEIAKKSKCIKVLYILYFQVKRLFLHCERALRTLKEL